MLSRNPSQGLGGKVLLFPELIPGHQGHRGVVDTLPECDTIVRH